MSNLDRAANYDGPVLCPNCGEPMKWKSIGPRAYVCQGDVTCKVVSIVFRGATEVQAAAIVRRMGKHGGAGGI